jgi:hypothetical protein
VYFNPLEFKCLDVLQYVHEALKAMPSWCKYPSMVNFRVSLVERKETLWKAVRFEVKGATKIQLATAVKRHYAKNGTEGL